MRTLPFTLKYMTFMFGELCWQLYPSLDYPTVFHVPCLCWLQALGLLTGTGVNLRAIIRGVVEK